MSKDSACEPICRNPCLKYQGCLSPLLSIFRRYALKNKSGTVNQQCWKCCWHNETSFLIRIHLHYENCDVAPFICKCSIECQHWQIQASSATWITSALNCEPRLAPRCDKIERHARPKKSKPASAVLEKSLTRKWSRRAKKISTLRLICDPLFGVIFWHQNLGRYNISY